MRKFSLVEAVCPFCGSAHACHVHAYYGRSLIDFVNGKRIRENVPILRVKCSSCLCTHAILPDMIIPYDSYGILFVLRALAFRFLLNMPVEKLCEKLGITCNLFYKWMALWHTHKKQWLGMIEDMITPDEAFIRSIMDQDPFSEFCSLFRLRFGISFLQSHKNPAQYSHHLRRSAGISSLPHDW